MSQSTLGFVYVLTNESIPGMVKIGYTTNLAEDRAKELFKTGVPTPFEIAFRVLSIFPKVLEELVHQELDAFRVTGKREFFRVTPEKAIDSVLFNRQFVDGISTYDPAPRILIDKGDHSLLSMKSEQLLVVFSYPQFPDTTQDVIDIWQAHTDGDTLELLGTDAKYASSFSKNDPFSLYDPLPFLNTTGTAANDEMNGKEILRPGDRLLWIDDSDPDRFRSVLFEMNTYCQVISRSRKSKINEDGVPLLLNYVTRDLDSDIIKKRVMATLALGLPNVLSEKLEKGEVETENTAQAKPIAEDWLPALLKKVRKRHF
ncbi:MAG: GIY-YIG nuclease family protein [Chitinophagaceae bacterium]